MPFKAWLTCVLQIQMHVQMQMQGNTCVNYLEHMQSTSKRSIMKFHSLELKLLL